MPLKVVSVLVLVSLSAAPAAAQTVSGGHDPSVSASDDGGDILAGDHFHVPLEGSPGTAGRAGHHAAPAHAPAPSRSNVGAVVVFDTASGRPCVVVVERPYDPNTEAADEARTLHLIG